MAATKPTSQRDAFYKLPFPLLVLTDATEVNSYVFSVVEEIMAAHMCDFEARSPATEVRSYAMDVLMHFVLLCLSDSDAALKFGTEPQAIPDVGSNGDSKPVEVVAIEIDTDYSRSNEK